MMDQELLVRPLDNGNGRCGADMIFSSEFDAIQDARRFDDPSLAQGDWVRKMKEADWPKAIRLCEDILLNQSKDLRVAAWLTEARGKVDGLAGMASGYRLLARLCETFWEDIHPLAEEGEMEQRVGPLDWLLNQTAQLIRQTPLTHSAKGCFSLVDQESARSAARNLERNPELDAEHSCGSPVSLDAFEAALRETPPHRFHEGLIAAGELHDAMSTLQSTLEGLLGQQAPSFGDAFDALDDVIRLFRRHGGNSPEAAVANVSIAASQAREKVPARIGPTADQLLQSREQALGKLREIAEFFRRTEPHSPVAYLADKAAHWGSMPLHEWLRAVVKDDGALSRMEELLGVERRSSESGDA